MNLIVSFIMLLYRTVNLICRWIKTIFTQLKQPQPSCDDIRSASERRERYSNVVEEQCFIIILLIYYTYPILLKYFIDYGQYCTGTVVQFSSINIHISSPVRACEFFNFSLFYHTFKLYRLLLLGAHPIRDHSRVTLLGFRMAN